MLKSLVLTVLGTLVLPMAALAQPGAIPTPVAAPIDAFQVGYASNLDLADSFVDLTNTGTLTLPTGLTTTGNICVNVYAFDPNEVLLACCSCLVTPNGLNSFSVNNDLNTNTINRQRPTSMVIKLLATTPVGLSPTGAGGHCDPTSPVATPAGPGVFGSLVPGIRAWHTAVHRIPASPGIAVTESVFSPSTLSPAELTKLVVFCDFIKASGGNGICASCRPGGQ